MPRGGLKVNMPLDYGLHRLGPIIAGYLSASQSLPIPVAERLQAGSRYRRAGPVDLHQRAFRIRVHCNPTIPVCS